MLLSLGLKVFFGGDKRMIHLTASAQAALRAALGSNEKSAGVRLVVGGGGAGLQYLIGLVDEADPGDYLIDSGGISLYVERDSLRWLDGTTVDYVVNLEGEGFSFDNPQAKGVCSRGKSFS
jgi:iron-sulfur cluster assembly protein